MSQRVLRDVHGMRQIVEGCQASPFGSGARRIQRREQDVQRCRHVLWQVSAQRTGNVAAARHQLQCCVAVQCIAQESALRKRRKHPYDHVGNALRDLRAVLVFERFSHDRFS